MYTSIQSSCDCSCVCLPALWFSFASLIEDRRQLLKPRLNAIEQIGRSKTRVLRQNSGPIYNRTFANSNVVVQCHEKLMDPTI